MNELLKYLFKKPVLLTLVLSLTSYCVYITIASLDLIYLEIIAIFFIGFLYAYEFKEPMTRDLRFSISVYFTAFSIIIYFFNDVYDLLKNMYANVFSILLSFWLYLSAIAFKEVIKSLLLFALTYILLYISDKIFLKLNKLDIQNNEKRLLEEPLLVAIIISSIYIFFAPLENFSFNDAIKLLTAEIIIIFLLGATYAIKYKQEVSKSLKFKVAIYLALISFGIYSLDFTHSYLILAGDKFLEGSTQLLSLSSYGKALFTNIYTDFVPALVLVKFYFGLRVFQLAG
ncbi:MAG: hypothetical protein MZU97_10860 [Bacillus subtilis]|nr:hypothetical protein [Bacillus subtilis]